MRFPRNNKVFRGQLDAAPYAGVLFLLVIFLLLNSSMVFVPGVPIQLPAGSSLPGIDGPTVLVAVDTDGRFYYEHQVIDEIKLAEKLRGAVAALQAGGQNSESPSAVRRDSLTLVVKADSDVKYRTLTRLWLMAREAGITNMLQATQPPLVPTPGSR